MIALEKLLPSLREKYPEEGYNLPPEEKILRWICHKSFLAFCLAVKKDFIQTKIHAYLAMQLQKLYEDVVLSRDRRMEICLPPQIGKSTIASVLFPAWVLGKRSYTGAAAWPIICASYGASLAERKSQECRDILVEPTFKLIFPNCKLHPDSTSKEFWRTTSGGSYRAVGVYGGLTGMSGKILIADDLIAGPAEAGSDTITNGTWDWWKTVFYTRKQSKSGFLLINTRWSLKDVSAHLEDQENEAISAALVPGTYDVWDRLKFPAIAEEDELLDGEPFRSAGEVLCPERFTMEDMIKTRNNLSPSDWSALYQQNPILNENAEFKSSWFQYFTESGDGKDNDILAFKDSLDIFVAVDLAISEKKSADNTSIQVIGKQMSMPNWYHLEENTGKMDPKSVLEYLFFLKGKYGDRLRRVGIESVGYQRSLIYYLTEMMKGRQEYFEVIELKNSAAKVDRIRGLIPLYKSGVIFHRRGVDNELERELLQFPKGKHDDRIDALSMLLQVVKNTGKGHASVFRPKMKRY